MLSPFRVRVLYSRQSAADLEAAGRRAGLTDLTLRPALRFWRDYLLQGGVLDGRVGAVQAGLSAFGVLLKYAFLWERKAKRGT